jgi:trigger factor
VAVKVETEKKPGSQVIVSVEVPADQVGSSIERAYQRLASRVRIPGFRPGKAPRPMVEKEIGWPALRREAIDLLLPEAYNAALDEAGLDPIDVPSVEVEQFDRGQPFRFRATVSVQPEVTLGDYHDIRVARPRTEVGDVDVNEALERLRMRFAELHDVDRPVQQGDFLVVDTHLMKSGAVLIGESQTNAQLEVDKERLVTGLAEGLIGQRIQETRDIRVSLPEDYPTKALAGQDVVFRVTLKSIKERRLPALDDDFAKQVGRGQTLAELQQEVKDDLQEAAAQSDQQRFENEVLKALADRTQVEVPEAMVEREVNRQVRELELRLQEQGIRFDRYLEYTNTSRDVIRAERRSQASQKVRLELALATVAEREGIAVSDAEVEAAVQQAVQADPHPEHQREGFRNADPVRAYFRQQLLMQKTVDYLSSVASQEPSDTMGPAAASGSDLAASPSKPGGGKKKAERSSTRKNVSADRTGS